MDQPYPKLYTNYVLPVKSYEEEGLCSILSNNFEVQSVISGKTIQIIIPSALKNDIYVGKDAPPSEADMGKIVLSDGRTALYNRSFLGEIERALDIENKFDDEEDKIWFKT